MKHNETNVIFILLFALLISINGFSNKLVFSDFQDQEREVAYFNSIKLSSSVDVVIIHGNVQSVRVVADPDALQKIKTEVDNSVLHVYTEDLRRSTNEMVVYVTMKELRHIKMTGSGDITSKNTIDATDFKFVVTGSGDLNLDLNATNLTGEMTGSGDVDIKGVSGFFKLQLSGSGDLNAGGLDLNECDVLLSGSGDIRLSGTSKNLNIAGSSSGDISASKLETAECKVLKTGSGDVSLWVTDQLYVKSTGSGDIYYRGNPKLYSKISGSGEIRKM